MPRLVSSQNGPVLTRAGQMMAERELQLVSAGLTPPMATAATKHAWGMADFHTRALSDEIRSQAFVETLASELGKCEGWARGIMAGMAK